MSSTKSISATKPTIRPTVDQGSEPMEMVRRPIRNHRAQLRSARIARAHDHGHPPSSIRRCCEQLSVDVDGDLAMTAGVTGQSKHQPPPDDH